MKKALAILLSFVCFALCSCSINCSNSPDSFSMSYFNTLVYVQTIDKPIEQTTKDKLNDLFSSLENEFDISNNQSLIYKFNHAPKGSQFTLSEQGKAVFEQAVYCYQFTDGYFNPAVYPLVELWQFAPSFPAQNFCPPTTEQVDNVLPLIDFESVSFNSQSGTLTKTKDGVMLDFGGILKGYAANKALEIMIADGHDKGYVSIGGSSIAILQSENLSIRHPRPTDDNNVILTLNTSAHKNLSVSSSGDYEKVYSFEGVTYSHLINPFSGRPAQTGVQSVNILGVDGLVSDALTTAGCLIDYSPNNTSCPLIEFFNKVVATHPSAHIYAVFEGDGVKQIITNKTLDSDFTLNDTSYQIVNF